MIASRLLEADVLYQTGALKPAAERLRALASATSQDGVRLGALSRLTEIACDLGEPVKARGCVGEMRRTAERAPELTTADRAELAFAAARCAFSERDASALTRGALDAIAFAHQSPANNRVWSLAVRANSYLAVDRYHRQELAGAGAAAQTAAEALAKTPDALPYVKTHALTTRAVIDLHDPERAHLAIAGNVDAFAIALNNGMTATAQDALFNIVNFWLFCDESDTTSHEAVVARRSLQEIIDDPASADPVLAALSLCSFDRHREALELIETTGTYSGDKSSSWLPMFFGPVTATKRARILFKAGRYADAERAAGEALDAWDRSGLGGQGTALRVRAEALEALGQTRTATAAIEDALGALQPMRPLHHMVGAYKCAHRLTSKRSYLENARHLVAALEKRTPPPTQKLTAREAEIAALVAQGCTNKTIAARLGISRRTVENHVASIFGRLGIRARWQLSDSLLARVERDAPRRRE